MRPKIAAYLNHQLLIEQVVCRVAINSWVEDPEETKATYGDIADWDVSQVTVPIHASGL